MGVEEQGDGIGVFIGALQRMGGHGPKDSGIVDGRFLGGSLQLPKGGQKNGGKNR